MVSHRHQLQHTPVLSTRPHLPLPGMSSSLPPSLLPDHPLSHISHIVSSHSRTPAAVLKAWSTHSPAIRGLINTSSCHCRGSWDHTSLTSLFFESLQSMPSTTLHLSRCHPSRAQQATWGCREHASSLCRQPQHPASPSLLFLPRSPSPDTSLQSSLGKKEPQRGQALSLTWSHWTKQRGAWVHSGPRSSDTRAFPQVSTLTAPHPATAKSSYHTVTTSILQRFETDAQRGRDTTQLESAWD